MKSLCAYTLIAVSLIFLSACSDSNNPSPPPPPTPLPEPEPEPIPFETLYEQGVDQYLGEYTPMMSETTEGIVQHTFGTGDGPLCLRGGEYTMATREAAGETS